MKLLISVLAATKLHDHSTQQSANSNVVICLKRSVDLHMAQLMPLPLTVSSFVKIQIGLTFLVLAHAGSLGQRAIKRVCVLLIPYTCNCYTTWLLLL